MKTEPVQTKFICRIFAKLHISEYVLALLTAAHLKLTLRRLTSFNSTYMIPLASFGPKRARWAGERGHRSEIAPECGSTDGRHKV